MDAMLEEEKCERLEEIIIDDDLDKFFQIGAQLDRKSVVRERVYLAV